MRTLAIGDIHGCHTSLLALLAVARPAAGDRVVFLGDYIDRGSASRSVLEWVVAPARAYSTMFVRGNHEEMMIEAQKDRGKADAWLDFGGTETLASYATENRPDWAAAIPPAHWRFLKLTLPFFVTKQHIFVHAGLDPDLDMQDQPRRLLYWGDFEAIKPHKSGKKIICGHSLQRSGQISDVGFAACIETGAAFGGWLTCLDVDSGEFWQANERGETRAGSLG
jgi:serine/threonine protein phosphatase 1